MGYSRQIIFSFCIFFIGSTVANQPDSGQRDKRNVTEYSDEVMNGTRHFEEELQRQHTILQLLGERYAKLVAKDQQLTEQDGILATQDADLAMQMFNQNAVLEWRNAELTNQIKQLSNQTQKLFRLNAQLVRKVELLDRKHTNQTQILERTTEVLDSKVFRLASVVLRRSNNPGVSESSAPTVIFYGLKQYRPGPGSKQPEKFEFSDSTCYASECCRNLHVLNDESQSLRTNDVCVKVYLDKDCSGQSRTFQKHTSISDLEEFTDKISSVKPCYNNLYF